MIAIITIIIALGAAIGGLLVEQLMRSASDCNTTLHQTRRVERPASTNQAMVLHEFCWKVVLQLESLARERLRPT